jgi:CRISPR/Cas system CSM-associated protein Csm3 (group 7 of RAMP superfamily)
MNRYFDKLNNRAGTYDYYIVKSFKKQREQLNSFHDEYKSELFTGELVLSIKCETDIFIGSGEVEVVVKDINKQKRHCLLFVHLGDKIIIPASSLKGAIRTYLETLSPSCIDQSCENDVYCPACSIFGSKGYQGRVFFEDAFPEGNLNSKDDYIAQRWSPNRKWEGRKFYFFNDPEIRSDTRNMRNELIRKVSANSVFETNILFENLEKWELGLLLVSMGIDPDHSFSLKIGGGKNRKLGKIKILLKEIKVHNFKEKFEKRIQGEEIKFQSFNEKGCLIEYWDKCKEWNIENDVKIILKKFNKGEPDEKQRNSSKICR